MDERFRGSVSHAYQAFHGELLRFLRKHLGSSADAADLAQDTFAQWLKWPGRQSVEQPRAFLFQIARNLLRDHWRRQQSRGQDLDRPAANDEPAALEGEAAGPGEQREVVLADGSKLFLDVDTQVQVRYAERTRDVLLKKGEVFFVVSHDPARPFRVGSGDSRVTVLGTQFSVRRNAQALAVAVKQGRVALQPSLEKDAEHVLLAGDSARLDLADQRLELGHVAPEQVASWRDGQLVFRDKPLGELVEELSRYRAAPIRLGDPRLAGKRVSGTVRIARPDDFLLALPALLPVRVQPQAGGEVLILAR
ncbi:TPA: FecR domain-containing protein [Pseudomonas aeruginosa]|nr:FecR domain-containing protein [Pseudomonas aeruginosa]